MIETAIKTEQFQNKDVKFRITKFEILVNARDLFSVINDEILVRTHGELCQEVFCFLKDSKFSQIDCYFETDKNMILNIWMNNECAIAFVKNRARRLASWCEHMIDELMRSSTTILESEGVITEYSNLKKNNTTKERLYSNAELAHSLGVTEKTLLRTLETEGIIERSNEYTQLFKIASLPEEGFIQILDYDGSDILFHLNDGDVMICISDLGDVFDKDITPWLHSDKTIDAGRAIEKKGGIPLYISAVVDENGESTDIKMWMNEEIALDLAYWIDSDFFIWCRNLMGSLSTLSLCEDEKMQTNMHINERFLLQILEAKGESNYIKK